MNHCLNKGNSIDYQNLFNLQSKFLDKIVSDVEKSDSTSKNRLGKDAIKSIREYAHDLLFSSDVDTCDLTANLSDLLYHCTYLLMNHRVNDEETVIEGISQEMDHCIIIKVFMIRLIDGKY